MLPGRGAELAFDPEPPRHARLRACRRLRDLGASVARDIISRGLEESLAYARAQHARHVLVVGGPGTPGDRLRALDLDTGGERTLRIAEVLAEPARHFGSAKGTDDG